MLYKYEGCSALANVIFKSLPAIGTDAFSGVNSTCKYNINLDDNSYVATGSTSISSAKSATYTRTMKNQWGTIVLPFDVANGNDYDFYNITKVDWTDGITLTKIDGTLPAGTPALIRISTAKIDQDDKTDNLQVTVSNATVNTTIKTLNAVNGVTLTGTYEMTNIIGQKGYIIANNAFWRISNLGGDIYCAPFHAWLAGEVSNAKSLDLNIEDEDADAIEAINAITSGTAEYYDLNGCRLNDLQKGINIVKFSNGTTKKVIIK